jgi:hypothetical protein
MIHKTERPIDPQKAHRLADALDAAGVAMLPPASTYPEGVHDALRPVIQEVLGRNVGQNADWIDVAFNLGTGPANRTHYQCYLLEVEDRDGWYEIATHIQEDEDDDALVPATHLGEKPVTVYAKELPALLREVRADRSNPSRRRAPPPPPSHTFVLEADPVQQGLFAPSSYEAKPKQRAAEPMFVDERQVDLFAPPPPKKNPRPARAGAVARAGYRR